MKIEITSFNEQDVREEIIAPLVRDLGYRSGTDYNIIREQFLRYPRSWLGRKDAGKDPDLRGKADYILKAGNVNWVIEAKAASKEISPDDVQQAWTYANHPEIRAVYFVLCNGRKLQIYRTTDAPHCGPVVEFCYSELQAKFSQLENILGPLAISRDFSNLTIDVAPPLAPGLRSMARITNGQIRFERNSFGIVTLNELMCGIRSGAIERDESGKMVGFLNVGGVSRSLQEFNDRLGLSEFEMVSEDTRLSTDPSAPTKFAYENTVTLPAGEIVPNILTGGRLALPSNLTVRILAVAIGTYKDGVFKGSFDTNALYSFPRHEMGLFGSFEINLS